MSDAEASGPSSCAGSCGAASSACGWQSCGACACVRWAWRSGAGGCSRSNREAKVAPPACSAAGWSATRRRLHTSSPAGATPPRPRGLARAWTRGERPGSGTAPSRIVDIARRPRRSWGGAGRSRVRLWSRRGAWHGPCQDYRYVCQPCDARRTRRAMPVRTAACWSAHVGRTRTGERVRPASFCLVCRSGTEPR